MRGLRFLQEFPEQDCTAVRVEAHDSERDEHVKPRVFDRAQQISRIKLCGQHSLDGHAAELAAVCESLPFLSRLRLLSRCGTGGESHGGRNLKTDAVERNVAEIGKQTDVLAGETTQEIPFGKFNVAAVAVVVRESSEGVVCAATANSHILLNVAVRLGVEVLAGQEPDQACVWLAQELGKLCAIGFRRREEILFQRCQLGAFGFDL